MSVLDGRTEQTGEAADPGRPWWSSGVSGIWTLTALVGLLVLIGVVSLFLHGAAAAICLVLGGLVTLAVVPIAVAVVHARGGDELP